MSFLLEYEKSAKLIKVYGVQFGMVGILYVLSCIE